MSAQPLDADARLRILSGEDPIPGKARPIDDTPQSPWLDRWEAATYLGDAIKSIPPPEPLIHGVLDRSSYATLIGAPGDGKSFLSIDWTMCLVTGTDWNGHTVDGGPVVYVAAEGTSGLGRRMGAWQEHHDNPKLIHPVHWLATPVNVFNREQAADLITYCQPRQPALIVLDTLARCIVGAEENSSKDMGEINGALEAIVKVTGACVLLVHHTGKDRTRGGRGSNSLLGAVTTEIEIMATSTRHTVKVTKQKEGPDGSSIELNRIQVADSCVLVPAGTGTADRVTVNDPGVMATLAALRSIEIAGGMTTKDWLDACEGLVGKTVFHQHKKALKESGMVVNTSTDARPRWLTNSYQVSEQSEAS